MFEKPLNFSEKLEQDKIHYRLEHVRDSIMVIVRIPGEFWELEFFEDGTIEIERFFSNGRIEDEASLSLLFE